MSLSTVSAEPPSINAVGHLLVKEGREFHCIAATKVLWCEAAGNYVRVCLGSRSVVVRSTLAAIAARLRAFRFQRISRTTIINLDHIIAVQPIGCDSIMVRLGYGCCGMVVLPIRSARSRNHHVLSRSYRPPIPSSDAPPTVACYFT
jgi:DNA-binding LytR/AlgR family response regulator